MLWTHSEMLQKCKQFYFCEVSFSRNNVREGPKLKCCPKSYIPMFLLFDKGNNISVGKVNFFFTGSLLRNYRNTSHTIFQTVHLQWCDVTFNPSRDWSLVWRQMDPSACSFPDRRGIGRNRVVASSTRNKKPLPRALFYTLWMHRRCHGQCNVRGGYVLF